MVQRIAEMRESGLLPPEAPFVPTATEAEVVAEIPQELPEKFSVEGVYNRLINDVGYESNEAIKAIAANLLKKQRGLTPEQIDVFFQDPDVNPRSVILDLTQARDRSTVGAFFEGLAREGLATAVGMEAAVPAASFAYKTSQPLRAIPYAGVVLPEAVGLSAGITAYLAGSGITQEGLEQVIQEDPYLPEDVPAREAGETVGAVVGSLRQTPKMLAKIPENVSLASGRILNNISKNKYIAPLQRGVGNTLQFIEQALPAIRREAIDSPKTVMVAEGVVAPMAGLGSAISESESPGEIGPRIAYEVVLGAIDPRRLLTPILSAPQAIAGTLRRAFSEQAREDYAALWLVDFLDEMGRASEGIQTDLLIDYTNKNPLFSPDGQQINVQDVIERFTDVDGNFQPNLFSDFIKKSELVDSSGEKVSVDDLLINANAIGGFSAQSIYDYIQRNPLINPATGKPISGLELTPAELARGNPALALLQQSFVAESGRLGADVAEANRKNLAILTSVIRSLEETKDPLALKTAAQLRVNAVRAMLQGRFENRINKAIEVEKQTVGRPGVEERMSFQEKIDNDITAALKDWRALERSLYQQIDFSQPATAENFLETWTRISSRELLNNEAKFELDGVIRAEIRDLLSDEEFEAAIGETRAVLEGYNKQIVAAEKALQKTDLKITKLQNKNPEAVEGIEALRDRNSSGYVGQDGALVVDFDELPELVQLQEMLRQARSANEKPMVQLLEAEIDRITDLGTVDRLKQQRDNVPTPELPVMDTEVDTDLGFLQKLRSRLLDLSRSEDLGTRWRNFYGQMAEAVLDDIKVVVDQVEARQLAGAELSDADRSLLDAHTVSREGNDIFRRTLAGDFVDETSKGRPRVPPENYRQRLFGGSADRVIATYNALRRAAQFPGQQGVEGAEQRVLSLEENYNNFLRNILNDVVEDQTFYDVNGMPSVRRVINNDKLRAKMNPDNPVGALLSRPEFAGLRNDLLNAETQTALIQSYRRDRSGRINRIQNNSILGQILNSDSPSVVVASALSDASAPVTEYKRLIRQINRFGGDPDLSAEDQAKQIALAKDALSTNTLNWAFDNAMNNNGFLSPTKAYEALFKPVLKDNPSVMQMMSDGGIIDPDVQQRLRTLLKQMSEIETQYRSGANLDELLDSDSPLAQFTLRVIGARAASAAVPGQGGQIQIPAAGASLMQSLFGKMPMVHTKRFIEEAVRPGNTEVFQALVERGVELRRKKGPKTRKTRDVFDSFILRTLGFSPVLLGSIPASDIRQEYLPREAEKPQELPPRVPFRRGEPSVQEPTPTPPPQPAPTPPPVAQAMPPAPPAPAPMNPQTLQRAAQILGPQDEIGALASEMLMRQRPA
tara:strand:+ start:1897 stop:5976 length:4080 start_codon:yes stop_codon:yes gene_type:complete